MIGIRELNNWEDCILRDNKVPFPRGWEAAGLCCGVFNDYFVQI